jgi:hypothetical protein
MVPWLSNGFPYEPIKNHENAFHPIIMLEYGTETLKWLPFLTNQKARKCILANHNAWTRYWDSEMASPLNQSKSTKMHLIIQSQCLNTTQHDTVSFPLVQNLLYDSWTTVLSKGWKLFQPITVEYRGFIPYKETKTL